MAISGVRRIGTCFSSGELASALEYFSRISSVVLISSVVQFPRKRSPVRAPLVSNRSK
jgi:hypothetical protein